MKEDPCLITVNNNLGNDSVITKTLDLIKYAILPLNAVNIWHSS